MFNVDEIIDMAVRLEKNGEAVYRQALSRATDPNVRRLLQALADKEVEHAEWFQGLREECRVKGPGSALKQVEKEILMEIFGDQSFSLKEAAIREETPWEKILETALEFERDSVLFYEMLHTLAQDEETRRCIHRMMEEERGHIAMLEEMAKQKDTEGTGL